MSSVHTAVMSHDPELSLVELCFHPCLLYWNLPIRYSSSTRILCEVWVTLQLGVMVPNLALLYAVLPY